MMNKCAWEIKSFYPDSRSGWYEIQGQQIWCDMETDGGGWMLVARVAHDDKYVTREETGGVPTMGSSNSAKFSDDFINQLRHDSTYAGSTPWRAHAEKFNVFPKAPSITPIDRLLTQTQFINAAMTTFNATAKAIDIPGATWMHIGYEHPVCMKLKTDEKTIGFGDHYYSGDTYFAWHCTESPDGFHAHWRHSSPGTFWVK
jgi:hypothetical protein